jgi:hypothetical protein
MAADAAVRRMWHVQHTQDSIDMLTLHPRHAGRRRDVVITARKEVDPIAALEPPDRLEVGHCHTPSAAFLCHTLMPSFAMVIGHSGLVPRISATRFPSRTVPPGSP